MNEDEILDKMNEVFKRVLGNQVGEIKKLTSPADLDQWTSLNHVLLIAETEKEFGVKFDLDDMMEFENVGDIIQGIIRKKI